MNNFCAHVMGPFSTSNADQILSPTLVFRLLTASLGAKTGKVSLHIHKVREMEINATRRNENTNIFSIIW